jgi:hypothetical protein
MCFVMYFWCLMDIVHLTAANLIPKRHVLMELWNRGYSVSSDTLHLSSLM